MENSGFRQDDYQYKKIFSDINVGIAVVNRQLEVLLWNHFMVLHSKFDESDIIGKSLTDCFPDISPKWLKRKINNVFLLNNNSYTSWKEKPFIFKFKHNRQVTSSFEYMLQDTTFSPVRNVQGEVEAVSIIIFDMTDVGLYHYKLKETNEAMIQLEYLAKYDALTGLYNRRHFENCLEVEINRTVRYSTHVSLLILDLDKFKQINDTFGHLAGDAVLKEVAARLKTTIRGTDIIGRFGGDEIVILLPGIGLDGARLAAEKFRLILDQTPVLFENKSIKISSSFGVAEYTKEMNLAKLLYEAADRALYAAKKNNRNCVVCVNDEEFLIDNE